MRDLFDGIPNLANKRVTVPVSADADKGDQDPVVLLASDEVSDTLSAGANQTTGFQSPAVVGNAWAVRRLTPVECERLQGFPDDFTRIPWRNKAEADCPDGPRYKALGNSMAVNVMRWIGKRIQMIEDLCAEEGL